MFHLCQRDYMGSRVSLPLFSRLSNASQGSLLTLAAVPSVLITVLIHFNSRHYINDDAYMTFRAVRNLMSGYGLVSNAGEAVLGTTTPLYATMLAGLSLALDTQPHLAYLSLNTFFTALCCILLVLIIFRYTSSFALASFGGVFFALSGRLVYSSFTGMETPVFVCWILLCALCLKDSNTRIERLLVILFATLALLTRPEGGLLFVLITLIRADTQKRIPRLEVVCFLSAGLGWLALNYYFFGSPIPQSVIAKRIWSSPHPYHAYYVSMQHLLEFFLPQKLVPHFLSSMQLLWLSIMTAVFFGVFLLRRQSSSATLLPLFSVGLTLAYSIANNSVWDWYSVPIEPGVLLAVLAVVSCVANLKRLLVLRCSVYGLCFTLLVAALHRYHSPLTTSSAQRPEGAGFLAMAWAGDFGSSLLFRFPNPENREELYKRVVDLHAEEFTRENTILAPEFGVIAYYTDSKLISSVGHVNPEVTTFFKKNPELAQFGPCISNALIEFLKPDYIFTVDSFLLPKPGGNARLDRGYEVIHSEPASIFQSNRMLLLRRRKEAP